MLLNNSTEYTQSCPSKNSFNSTPDVKKRQNESFDNFRQKRMELESCKPNSSSYQAKKQAYETATMDFLECFDPIISFAIKKVTKGKNINPSKLYSIKEDLKTDAQMMILDSEKKYCPNAGASFQSFAIQSLLWKLPHKISQYTDAVQIPARLMRDSQKTLAKLYSKGVEIEKLSVEEICKLTNCSKNVAESIVDNILSRDTVSIETSWNKLDETHSRSESSLKSREELPLNNVIYSEYMEILNKELQKLTAKRREVVLEFINSHKKSLTDTAKKLGLSTERVRKVVSGFMEHITSLINEKNNLPTSSVEKTTRKVGKLSKSVTKKVSKMI